MGKFLPAARRRSGCRLQAKRELKCLQAKTLRVDVVPTRAIVHPTHDRADDTSHAAGAQPEFDYREPSTRMRASSGPKPPLGAICWAMILALIHPESEGPRPSGIAIVLLDAIRSLLFAA